MNHPSEEWRDETSFPFELKDNKKRFLDRDIRFSSVDKKNEDDLWKCFKWELYRTIAFCNKMPPSFDRKIEFPFYVSSFPSRSYLSHDFNERSLWTMLRENDSESGLARRVSDINEDEDNLLSELGMEAQIDYIEPLTLGIRNWQRLGFRKRKKQKVTSLPRKLELKLTVNPNWTKNKLKTLFENQIKEIYEEIQWNKEQLGKKRRVIPHVYVEFTPELSEKEFRERVKRQTEEACRVMKSDKKYFETIPIEFDEKNKSLVSSLKSRLKLLGHYRLRYCVGLGWRKTCHLFKNDSHDPLKCEDNFKSKIRKIFSSLPCD